MSDLNEFLILLQAKLDKAKSKKNINTDIDFLQNQIKKIRLQAEIDTKSIGTGQETGKTYNIRNYKIFQQIKQL